MLRLSLPWHDPHPGFTETNHRHSSTVEHDGAEIFKVQVNQSFLGNQFCDTGDASHQEFIRNTERCLWAGREHHQLKATFHLVEPQQCRTLHGDVQDPTLHFVYVGSLQIRMDRSLQRWSMLQHPLLVLQRRG